MEDAIKERWYILDSRSPYRLAWDVIIIFFAVINGVTLPLEIAFDDNFKREDDPNRLDDPQVLTFDIINIITTVIFVLDIITGFMTSYVLVSTGDEIFGLKHIAIHYICEGAFIIDILSTFPMDTIFEQIMGGKANMTDNQLTIRTFLTILGILKI